MAEAEDPALADELLARMGADQAVRHRAAQLAGPDGVCCDEDVARQMTRVDRENSAWMSGVLERHGWPDRRLVGDDGGEAAWLLCQHADLDPALQRRALALLERAVAAGNAPAKHLAYLTDRVLVGEGAAQRYGTQFHPVNGHLVPQPIEEMDTLDERRAAMGLCPFAEYAERFRRQFPGRG